MIERAEFARGWKRLEARFGEQTEGVAGAYYEYLTERMGTETFLDACRAVWATREFFPRPADFLQVGAEAEWRTVLRAIEGHRPPHDSGWTILHADASERATEAVRSLGGLPALVSTYERDPIRARRVFLEAYEAAVIEDAMQQLPDGDRGPALPPGVTIGTQDGVEVDVEALKP